MCGRTITKAEHVKCEENDRWIYIERYTDGTVGLNFMQEASEEVYPCFKKHWCKVDEKLTDYYHYMCETFTIEREGLSELEFMNKVFWTYVQL